jgi:hypothetical protein
MGLARRARVLKVIQWQRPLGRVGGPKVLRPRAVLRLEIGSGRRVQIPTRLLWFDRRHDGHLGHQLGCRRDNDARGNRIELVGREASAEVGELRVFGEQLCHSLLELGDLSQLSKLGLIFVEIGVERLGFGDQLGLLGKSVHTSLKHDTSIWRERS